MPSRSKAGYATDINYANKLITMIEQYKLMQYDDTSELPNEPDDPESPETPEEEPSFPSKEYAGNDIPLNKNCRQMWTFLSCMFPR